MWIANYFAFDTGDATFKQFMEELIDSNLISDLINLKIMDPNIDWTEKMMRALSKACEYIQMLEKKAGGSVEVIDKMSTMLNEYVNPM